MKIETEYLTGQEHLWVGSSPGPKATIDIYVPLIILRAGVKHREFLEYINEQRQNAGVFISGVVGGLIGINQRLAFSLEPLDLQTGRTLRDPRLLGIWDQESEQIITVPGREINQEYRQALKQGEEEYPRLYKYYFR